jgi:hypothetical protein
MGGGGGRWRCPLFHCGEGRHVRVMGLAHDPFRTGGGGGARSEHVDERLDLQDTTGRHSRPLLWVI